MDEFDMRERYNLLAAASRHPNSNVAKLISQYLNDNCSKTLVILLEELEKHDEYATDLTLAINYFLKCINRDLDDKNYQFSEIGRMLKSVANIWSKRVEDVYNRAESQACSLSNNSQQTEERSSQETGNDAAAVAAPATLKPKSRKRPIHDDKNELKMDVKAFKRVAANKLFADCDDKEDPQMLPQYFADEHINPTLYRSSFIIDPDNAENIDRKNNYKIFHYHMEHRYNTPVSDYNFRLHFAIKDYMHNEDNGCDDDINEVDETMVDDHTEQVLPSWAPQQYLEKAIGLENQAFEKQLSTTMSSVRKRKSGSELGFPIVKIARMSLNEIMKHTTDPKVLKSLHSQDSGICDNSQPLTENVPMKVNPCEYLNGDNLSFNPANQAANSSELKDDSITNNPENNAANNLKIENATEGVHDNSTLAEFNDSSILNSTKVIRVQDTNANTDLGFGDADKVLPDVDLTKHKLSQSDDEGIVLSDQEESYRHTPTDDIEQANQQESVDSNNARNDNDDDNNVEINVPAEENVSKPTSSQTLEEEFQLKYPLTINIFGIKESALRRKAAFKLPNEINCFYQEQEHAKSKKKAKEVKKQPQDAGKAAINQLNKYNRMGASSSFFSQARSSGCGSINSGRDGYDSDDDDMDFTGFEATSEAHWDNEDLVYPKINIVDEIPQVREMNLDDDTPIIPDQSIFENREIAEQSVLEADLSGAIINQDVTDEIVHDIENINITSPNNVQINDEPELLGLPDQSHNDETLLEDNMNRLNLANPADDDFIESEDEVADDVVAERLQLQAESEQKIREWHRRIQPALAQAHQRQHFSIFDIGTKIINKISNGADTLEKITSDDDPQDLSKNFLSLLILTNQGNVKIDARDKNYNEPTKLSDLKVELLSRKRREVHVEDDIGATDTVASSSKRIAKETSSSTRPNALEPTTSRLAETTTSRVPATKANIKLSDIPQMVRTLQPIPKASNTDDNDSGVGSFISQDTSIT